MKVKGKMKITILFFKLLQTDIKNDKTIAVDDVFCEQEDIV